MIAPYSRALLTRVTLFLYIFVIFFANVMIARFGLIPVGFGLVAPAGVYLAGLSFSLRDAVQEVAGRRAVIVTILIGAACSAAISGPLAIASGAAFLLSEVIDLAVYTPLRWRSWLAAVLLSNTAGAVVDSAIFLALAGYGMALMPGQVIGKTWATLATVAAVAGWSWTARWVRRRRADRALQDALDRGFGLDEVKSRLVGAYGITSDEADGAIRRYCNDRQISLPERLHEGCDVEIPSLGMRLSSSNLADRLDTSTYPDW